MANPTVPLYKQLQNRIQVLIRERNLAPGDQLPSINALAETFAVNGLTVRRALAELAAKGVAESRHGRGTFVAPPQTKTIHWITAVDIFSTDISPFYAAMLRETSTHLRQHGYKIHPQWVGYDRGSESSPFMPDDPFPFPVREGDGFFFCGCLSIHPLLISARGGRLPFVHISNDPQPKAWDACVNPHEGDRVALEHLVSHGIRKLGVLTTFQNINPAAVGATDMAIETLKPPIQHTLFSEVETAGYRMGLELSQKRPDLQAWYITDDGLAKGASRVLLGMPAEKRPQLVVRTSRQQIVPLGLPTTYVTFDMDRLAREAVRLFDDCVEHRAMKTFFMAEYEIVRNRE